MSEVAGNDRLVAGRYRLVSRLGEGGMGVVWRALDETLHREVAVKEVRAPAALGTTDVRRLYTRLEREAWAAARISHRNVVTVYDVANEDGRPWIVMELIRGLALSDELEAEGPLPPQRAAHIGAEVLAALRGAHEAGVLHRDVKPGNVLLAHDGRVVLTDFGIATMEGTSSLTMTGELIGSPEYLAPERALGRTPGPESDLWSLGVLLYATVENYSPFRQDTPLSTMRAVVDEELPRPRRAGPLAPVIEGLLRKDPAERLSAAAAEGMLREVAAGRGGPPTRTAHGVPVVPAPGTPPLGTYGPYTPTMAVSPGTPPHGTHPLVSTTLPSGGPPQGRSRRAAAALAAGAAVLVLAVGGLVWALANGDAGQKEAGTAGSGSSPSTSQGAVSAGASDTPDDGTGTAGGSKSPSATAGTGSPSGGTGRPGGGSTTGNTVPQSVTVRAWAVRDRYHGYCPPPEAEAPAFSASFTVGRTPASVRYRWRTQSGKGDDGAWRTLDFPAGGPRTMEVHRSLTGFRHTGELEDSVRVSVSRPVETWSGWVPFSVNCRTESPSYESSSPPSPTPTAEGGTTEGTSAALGTHATELSTTELSTGR